MIPRTIKRYSSGSNAASVSARAGIRTLIMTSADQQPGNNIQEASYATKTFEDGDASPMSGTPLSSRRSSLASNTNVHPARGRRGSSLLASSPLSTPTDSSVSTPASARAFSSTAPTLASDEHGAYQFTPKELAAVQKRVEEEFALKSVVSSTKSSSSRSSSPTRSGSGTGTGTGTGTGSLLQPRRPSTKVPYEAPSTDGLTRHPSGFIVPSPGPAPSTLATDARIRPPGVSSARGVQEGVASYKDLSERATAGQWTRSEKVPQEVKVQGMGGERQVVQHPSGFVPPTPQQDAMRTVKEVYKPAVDLANAGNA